jgi:outer membrane immunogenic protein
MTWNGTSLGDSTHYLPVKNPRLLLLSYTFFVHHQVLIGVGRRYDSVEATLGDVRAKTTRNARYAEEIRMKRLLIAGVLALAAIGQAVAADLPQPAPPPPQAPVAYIPTVAPVYNWGGIYWGINGGYGFGKSDWTTGATAVFAAGSTGNFDVSGFLVGGTLGFNYQMDAFVVGLEGDLDYSGMDGNSGSCSPACETKNTWLGTARARLGYAADRVLFYGTVGGAFGNIESNTALTGFQSSTKGGWVAGAGVEAAFADNWTARIEYLFVDLQNASVNAAFPGAPGVVTPTTVSFDGSLIRAGLDYKFR